MLTQLTLTHRSTNLFSATNQSLLKTSMLMLAGVIVLALASQLVIPLQPVPLTFQSATVVLIGMAYGSRNGSLVVLSYLIAGLCGIPVFANLSAGPAPFMGPTVGYLIGFLPAAFVSGYLAERGFGRHLLTSLMAALIGVGIIFFSGLSALSTFIGWDQAIQVGLLPFIASEPVKLLAVALIIPRLWKNE